MSKIIFIRNLGPCFCELIQQLHKELYVIMLSLRICLQTHIYFQVILTKTAASL